MSYHNISVPSDKNIIKTIKELQSSIEDLKKASDKSNNSMIWLTRVLVVLTIILSLPVITRIIDQIKLFFLRKIVEVKYFF